MSSVPANVRIKLREEKVQNFEQAFIRAQELHDIIQNELNPKENSSQSINTMAASLAQTG